eukprot:scaffold82630_cov18-Tisochrysis_lutea.AAC.1
MPQLLLPPMPLLLQLHPLHPTRQPPPCCLPPEQLHQQAVTPLDGWMVVARTAPPPGGWMAVLHNVPPLDGWMVLPEVLHQRTVPPLHPPVHLLEAAPLFRVVVAAPAAAAAPAPLAAAPAAAAAAAADNDGAPAAVVVDAPLGAAVRSQREWKRRLRRRGKRSGSPTRA